MINVPGRIWSSTYIDVGRRRLVVSRSRSEIRAPYSPEGTVKPAPDPHTASLTAARGPTMTEILQKYGATWQIEIAEPASFIAIRRPTLTAQEVVIAHSL